jgi:hypothetical protein
MQLELLGRTCVFVRFYSRLYPVERFWGSLIPRKIRGQEADDPQTRKVNSADRGFSTTDLNGHSGTQTIPEVLPKPSASRCSRTTVPRAPTPTVRVSFPGEGRFSASWPTNSTKAQSDLCVMQLV